MSLKELALKSISDLPEDVALEEIQGRLRFLSSVEEARKEAARGEVVPHAEVHDLLEKWITG